MEADAQNFQEGKKVTPAGKKGEKMKCPYCNFEFKTFFSNGKPEEMSPLLCEDCCRVSILISGNLYRMNTDQLEALKKSPAWRDVIEPATKIIQEAKRKKIPPVDRSQRTLIDGSPETPDHREINISTGMQKSYIVLSAEERAKGFQRPVRRTYTHKVCGVDTTMGLSLAETYARDPEFYDGTFCVSCKKHFPLDQFVWADTDERVGS